MLKIGVRVTPMGSKCQVCSHFVANWAFIGVLPRGCHVIGVKNGFKSSKISLATQFRQKIGVRATPSRSKSGSKLGSRGNLGQETGQKIL